MSRWFWLVVALLGAQLLAPREAPPRRPPHARELKRLPAPRPASPLRPLRQD